MKFSPDGESEIIRVADSEIVPVGTVKLPPQDGGSDEEWQPQGQRKGNTLLPEEVRGVFFLAEKQKKAAGRRETSPGGVY